MYSLVGPRAIMENIVVLTCGKESVHPRSLQELRQTYRDQFLVHSEQVDTAATPHFITGGDALVELVEAFDLPQRRNDVTTPAPSWRAGSTVEGWRHLLANDRVLGSIAETVVGTVFVTGADWTGSMSESRNVGTLWIMPGRNWRVEEVAEAYLHELTHTLLFLDERRYGHFLPAAANHRVRSAIRQDLREYAAVVHSVLVAAELLAWRDTHKTPDSACCRLHGPTAELLNRARSAYSQVVAEDASADLLTQRMKELVALAGDRISDPA